MSIILRIRIFVNRKILILRIFLRKMTILRKILRIRLILRIRIFVNTGPGHNLVDLTTDLLSPTGLEHKCGIQKYLSCLRSFQASTSQLIFQVIRDFLKS